MNPGRALRLLQAISGLGQNEMARLVGLDQSSLSLLVSGKRNLSHAARTRLLEALEIQEPLFHLLGATRGEVEALGSAAAPLAFELVLYIAGRNGGLK